MELGRVVLVGHDWGGALAFDWAARHPERVRGSAFLESIVKPMSWDELSPQAWARGEKIRGAEGEDLYLPPRLPPPSRPRQTVTACAELSARPDAKQHDGVSRVARETGTAGRSAASGVPPRRGGTVRCQRDQGSAPPRPDGNERVPEVTSSRSG